jgi:hypothetical protein
MRKDLLRRLEELESRFAPPPRIQWVWVTHPIDATRKASLAENERIVCDIYAWDRHGTAYGRYRITTDPADEGRSCQEGGYLEDVVRELGLDDRYLSQGPVGSPETGPAP